MKKLSYIFSAFSLLLAGCEFDNYEPPKSMLTGRLVYEGTPIGVRQDINVLQLYEPGWQTLEPIGVNVKQDGTFSALLFDGTYKLVPIAGNGPFIVHNTDTIDVQVQGGQTPVDVPVVPFFMIRSENFQTSESALTATFNIDRIVENANLDKVGLFVGRTMLVDNQFNIAKNELNSAAIGNLSEVLTVSIDKSSITEDYVFARIGVKAKESSEYIFTQVQKIQIQ